MYLSLFSRALSASFVVSCSFSLSAFVINVSSTSSVLSDSIPSTSTTVTATLYLVPTLRPVNLYSVPSIGNSFCFLLSRYTLYPGAIALSAAGSQVTIAVV